MRWSHLALALTLLATTACATTGSMQGRATSGLASVNLIGQPVVVRPSEVRWVVRGGLDTQVFVAAADASGSTLRAGGLGTGARADTPPAVQIALTRAVAANDADGVLLTHYVISTAKRNDEPGYLVKLSGRLLDLQDMGPLDSESFDRSELQSLRAAMAELQ